MRAIHRAPGARRSPRHERMALVLDLSTGVSDYEFPDAPCDTSDFPIIEIIDDEDTGPKTQILYTIVPPRPPARRKDSP